MVSPYFVVHDEIYDAVVYPYGFYGWYMQSPRLGVLSDICRTIEEAWQSALSRLGEAR